MILRQWHTSVDPARVADYDTFAAERSISMFRQQPGLVAVLLGRSGTEAVAASLWSGQSAVDQLAASETYQRVSGDLGRSGYLVGNQSVTYLPILASWISPDASTG